MATANAVSPLASPLSQTVDVETPELVVLSYTIAGVGSRASAALIDYLICFVAALALIVAFMQFGGRVFASSASGATATTAWAVAILGLFQFAVLWLYYVLFEALGDGQTPGKRVMKLRVVRDGGLSVTFEASAIRNLVRAVDMQPLFFYAVGMVTLVVNPRGKRLGDMAAGTIVVKEDLISQPMVAEKPRDSHRTRDSALPVVARLTDEEFRLLDRFVQRRMDFDPDRRGLLARGLAERLSAVLEQDPSQLPVAQLVRLHEEEHAARARGIASRHDTGAARERHAIVATNAPRWAAFAERLTDAQRRGLKGVGEQGVREFVQEYRELTADLARLRTATRGQESPELFYLNRLVSSAHSLLYRRRSLSLRRIIDLLFVDVPAEIRRSVLPIGLASALLFGPMIIAARSVVMHPEVAASLLPPAMLDRAEEGVTNARSGKGYIEDPEVLRPLFASRIITNNVQVAFGAFALGITAGVLTLWVLVTNGISIGAMFGLYASKDIFGLLLAFVAPHGVLELTAIVIAGGAGFLLAAGMLVPGERTRRTALAENARRAIRLVAGSAFLLLFAGALEGFVSPIPSWPLRDKLLVSAATAVLLTIYLRPWAGLVRPPTSAR
jgi:uncharacterized membrane protein SpoIIM required for sporulation/uncharacterized RDD family membrane protein YckC